MEPELRVNPQPQYQYAPVNSGEPGVGMQQPFPQQMPQTNLPQMPQTNSPQLMPQPMPPQKFFKAFHTLEELFAYFSVLFIKQQEDLIERVIGVELPNTYWAYEYDQNEQKKANDQKLITFKQRSRCFSLEVDLYAHLYNAQVGKPKKFHFLKMKKAFQCTIHPVIEVFTKNPVSEEYELLGSIFQYYGVCTPKWRILKGISAKNIQNKFSLRRNYDYVVRSIHCCKRIRPKEKIPFTIEDNKKQEVGKIIRFPKSIEEIIRSDADTYTIEFPLGVDWQTKALLLATVIAVDYQCFEDNASNNKRRRRW